MTRIIRRTPDPDRRVVHTEAKHRAGACETGCPWCMTKPAPPPPDDIIVIVDEPPTKGTPP